MDAVPIDGVRPRRDLWIALAVALATCAVFARALVNGFVAFDDDAYVTANPDVLGGLTARGVAWAFTAVHSANWHPLTWLSHMLDVSLFGRAPAGHHATSVLLHAANAALFYLFLARATGRAAPAVVAAALFALHPQRVESVAWVAERKDVLAGLFFFLALLAWERYVRTKARAAYAMALAAHAAGLLGKPMLVTLPLVLLLLEHWPLARAESLRARVLDKVPFVALSLGSCAVTLVAQHASGATATAELLPWGLRLENAALACLAYLRQMVLPLDLACLYPHPGLAAGEVRLLGPALGAAAVLAAVSLVLFLRRATLAPLAVGWATFLVGLVPVIGIVQVGNQSHADRYTYLPATFLGAGVVYAWASLSGVLARRVGAGIAVGALVACAFLTSRQIATWKDSAVLWETAARRTKGNYLAFFHLGEARRERGDLEPAAQAFQEALAIRADLPEVESALGGVRLELGDAGRAVEAFERARALRPRDPRYGLELASARLAAGELEAARALLAELARAGEDGAELHFDLGLLAQSSGDAREAERAYRAALEREPTHGGALNDLGEVLLAQGDAAGAIAAFERLVELEPEDAGARYNLGCAYEAAGERERAREAFRRALELDPALAPAAERLRNGDE